MARSALWIALLVGCGGHRHDESAHPHDDELPARSVTLWTGRHELFVEYPPLVVGDEAGFAAHVTVLPSFEAATAGVVTVTVVLDGELLTGRADVADPPGIFRPKVKPVRPGKGRLRVTIERDGGKEEMDAGDCEVFPDAAAARRALGDEQETPGRIAYLKEQQWKTEFATQPVGDRDLQPGVRAAGEIRAVAGKEARLTAPAAGRVVLADPAPVLGMTVKRGQVLATVAPRLAVGGDRASLDADVAAARAEADAAQAQAQRAERLFADQAIPEKQVEEARTRVRVARARLDAATGRLAQYEAGATGAAGAGRGALQIRSPIDGTLVAIDAASGQSVGEGDPLLMVMDLDRVWLHVQIFEPDIPRVESARSAWFTIEGYDTPFPVDETNGRVVTLGRVLDPETRTVPLIFELENPDGRLRVGQFAKVVVATGAPVRVLAIPDSALVDDAGKPVAYVQVEGEAFERRPLTLGIRSNRWVEVKDGLEPGERVVIRGAYELRLASAAGRVPAHGHVH